MAWAAIQLGAPADEAGLLARAMEALEPEQASDYATTECHAGHRLDLHPETSDFPTETPLRPPRGRGGTVSDSHEGRASRTASSRSGACRRAPPIAEVRDTTGCDPRQRRRSHASIPRCRRPALWRSQARSIAGGVGTHEWALPTPDRVDLAGRCVHARVHRRARPLSRRGRSTRRDVQPRDGGLGRARRSRSSAAHPRRGTWIRGTGWRDAAWPRSADGGRASTRSTGSDAGRSVVEGLPLALARTRPALARAGGDLDVPGGVVERDARRLSPPGSCARSRPGGSGSASSTVTDDEWVDAVRDGIRVANARGVGSDSRQGRCSAPRRSSAGSTSGKGCRFVSGSRSPPTGSRSWPTLGLRSRDRATTSCASAT